MEDKCVSSIDERFWYVHVMDMNVEKSSLTHTGILSVLLHRIRSATYLG